MERKLISIGTRIGELYVGFSDFPDNILGDFDPEKAIWVQRDKYDHRQYNKFSEIWTDNEIDFAIKKAAEKLVNLGITPSKIRPYGNDHFEELTEVQMERFKEYCEQEASKKN